MEGFSQPERILPYGETLHYDGCGCPAQWAPATRAADMVDLLAQVIQAQAASCGFVLHEQAADKPYDLEDIPPSRVSFSLQTSRSAEKQVLSDSTKLLWPLSLGLMGCCSGHS